MGIATLVLLLVAINQKALVLGVVTSIGGPAEPQDVAMEAQFFKQNDMVTATIKLIPSIGTTRIPVHFCIVFDVSGTMGYAVVSKDANRRKINYNFSRLDLGRHAIKAVIETMCDHDWLSIVTFSKDANLVFGPTLMSTSGKETARKKLADLKDYLSTNLWAGVACGWDTVRKFHADHPTFLGLSSMLVFTDGWADNMKYPIPNVVLYKEKIKQYKEMLGVPCSVNTFGFGYELDPNLLNLIAELSGGVYAYIPDCNYVGTVFTHLIANLYTILAKDVELKIETREKFRVLGGHQMDYTDWGAIIRVNYLRYDQIKDFVLEFEGWQAKEIQMNIYLDYTLTANMLEASKSVEVSSKIYDPYQGELEFHTLRCHLIDTVNSALDEIATAEVEIMKRVNELNQDDCYDEAKAHHAYELGEVLAKIPPIFQRLAKRNEDNPPCHKTQQLLQDITGEITLAFANFSNFTNWGRNWVPSSMSAHREQVRNNFKDPGVQIYGGKLFEAIEKDGYEFFEKNTIESTLEIEVNPNFSPSVDDPPIIPAKSFRAKKDGCFHEDALVHVVKGGVDVYKKARNITRGDQVRTLGNKVVTVVCVLEMKIEDGNVDMVTLPGGLVLTPYHPVFDIASNKWVFPIHLNTPVGTDCNAIYSFVLDSEHSVIINGVPCVTLGHGAEDEVRKHPYFGTHLVLDDLKRNSGWILGKILFSGTIRDKQTGLVCGFDLGETAYECDSVAENGNGNFGFQNSLEESGQSVLQSNLGEYWRSGLHHSIQFTSRATNDLAKQLFAGYVWNMPSLACFD